jgi:hypothetical protein
MNNGVQSTNYYGALSMLETQQSIFQIRKACVQN